MKRSVETRWHALPARRRALLRWGLPLLGLAVLVAVDWIHLQRQGTTTPAAARELLRNVGLACAVSWVVLFAGVRRWPLQTLGLFALMAGLAGLCLRVVANWGPQPVGESERDLIQAVLDVGSIVILIGLLIWSASRLLGASSDAPDTWDGTTERRSGRDRRRFPWAVRGPDE